MSLGAEREIVERETEFDIGNTWVRGGGCGERAVDLGEGAEDALALIAIGYVAVFWGAVVDDK